MPVRINQLSTIRRGSSNEEFPVPDGYIGGQTMASAGASSAMAAGTRFVEVAATESISINGYGDGSTCYVFANTVAYFPAKEGQTFTWSVLS
jgi:hypothetical protein